MRLRRSLWTVLALLVPGGVAFLSWGGQGHVGVPSSAERRPAVEAPGGPALSGLGRSRASGAGGTSCVPAGPATAAAAFSVPDDGEAFSVAPEPGQVALTLRLASLDTGTPLAIGKWIVRGDVWDVPPGRTPRLPVVPGGWLNVKLAQARHPDGTWRLLSEYLVLKVPSEPPQEMSAAIPTLDDPRLDPIWVVPFDSTTGEALRAGSWVPPPGRTDLAPIVADVEGRLPFPRSLLRTSIEDAASPLGAVRGGLVVPGFWRGEGEGVAAPTLDELRHLGQQGELRVGLVPRPAAHVLRRLRLLDLDGTPAARALVVLDGNGLGRPRLLTDAAGVLAWHGPLEHPCHVSIHSADGWLREVFELPASAGLGVEPARVVLPDTALVTLEFVLPDGAGASRDGLPRDLDLGIFGRLYPPEGDPEPPAAAGVPELVDNTGGRVLDTQLDFNAPRVRLRLPLHRELQLSTVIAPVHPAGHGLPVLFDFVLDAPVARLVFDWPPTRILSRHER